MEVRFARVAGFLISTLIGLAGETFGFTVADEASAPNGSHPMGTTEIVDTGRVLVVRMKTGAGPTLVNHTVLNWTGSGGS